jgi:hypothetical protein
MKPLVEASQLFKDGTANHQTSPRGLFDLSTLIK